MEALLKAEENFARHVRHNRYPGRGLVLGRSTVGDDWLIIYWIMGRSAHSRNRKFVVDDVCVRTEPVDVRHLDDPGLIIYDAMLELPGRFLVGNGDQVRSLYEGLQTGETFDDILAKREREPDAPHYTPRISALLDLNTPPGHLTLSILKANPINAALTDRYTYRPAAPPAGFAFGLTTYAGDGNPLPSFTGDPLLLPCQGSAEEVLKVYWHALDPENRISIAVKRISPLHGTAGISIRNRFASPRDNDLS
jgi:IMP cyclohydrolase